MADPPRRLFEPGTRIEDLKAYMGPFVARLGYKFNSDTEFVDAVLESELELLESEGDVWCPCRIRPDDRREHAKYVCPCIPFYLDAFGAVRKCWCGLFVRGDVERGEELHGAVEIPPGPKTVRVAAASDLADGQGKTVKVGKREIALFRVGDEFYALSNLCLHMYGPLGEGYLDGHHVMCPWHGWRYDVRDGNTDHPGADVRTYPVEVRDGEVFVTV
ncbi:MAG: Rieske 2Fe-2S domain-containing protein [Coriobacteriia bacterium]|nr:Rieske 2Fe-2S domain-containing protein [Coriobacteriia bacterium]